MADIADVVSFDHMRVGRKGGGKHWTADEVKRREAAAKKMHRPKKKALRMPDWLDDEAVKVWKKVNKDMKDFDILDKVDEDTLAAYCDAVARHKEISLLISEEGYTTYNAAGTKMANPNVKTQQGYARLILQYSEKLGLTANARARLAKKMADEEGDPNDDLFD